MRKLIQASLLTIVLTASIHAGEIGQPIPTGDMPQPVATGYMPNGITELGSAILEAMLSLF